MDFTKTILFRLLRVNISSDVTHPNYKDILQQKWINNEGYTEWRDVDLIIEDNEGLEKRISQRY
jgi:hypothetical protein